MRIFAKLLVIACAARLSERVQSLLAVILEEAVYTLLSRTGFQTVKRKTPFETTWNAVEKRKSSGAKEREQETETVTARANDGKTLRAGHGNFRVETFVFNRRTFRTG